jgi:tetratricopeptide (TPR) repeat protein
MMKRIIASTLAGLSRYLLVGRFLRLYIKLLRPLSPAVFYKVASRSYRFHGKNGVANGISQRGIQRFPRNVPLLIEHGDCLLQGNEFQRATNIYSNLIKNNQAYKMESVWLKLAKSYQLQDKHQTAEFVFLKACKLFPKNEAITRAAAKNAYHIQDWESAKECWSNLLKLKVNMSTKEQLWAARSFRNGQDVERAKTLLYQIFSDDIHGLEATVEYASIETEAKNYREALKVWEKAKQQRTNDLPISLARTIDFNISLISRILDPISYKKRIKTYRANIKKNHPKIAVYTSYTAGYDVLKPHQFIDDRFEYVAFTDEKPIDYGLYDIRLLPTDHTDGRVSTRYPKTHPHKLFPDYDVAIWLDTSIMLVDDIYPIVEEFLASGKAIGTTPHTHRESLFEEFVVCMERSKDSFSNLKSLYSFYAGEGFEYNNLSENGFLLFRLQHPDLPPALELWWDMILTYSKRDQLSFGYSLSKSEVDWYRISDPPHNINNNPSFIIAPHKQSLNVIHELEKRLV